MYNQNPKSTIVDYSPRTGVFVGDLRYGRKSPDGIVVKHHDFENPNEPVVPLALVEPRDPQIWKRDGRIKIAKKNVDQGILSDYIKHVFRSSNTSKFGMRANIHITIGKERI